MCLLLSRRNMILSTPVKHLGEGNGTPLQYSCLEIPWWRSLVGCSPWGREESGTTEQLHFHFSLSCIGEGNGNPLRCSWPGESQGWGAWWAAVYGVAQSQTWVSSNSSISPVSDLVCSVPVLIFKGNYILALSIRHPAQFYSLLDWLSLVWFNCSQYREAFKLKLPYCT